MIDSNHLKTHEVFLATLFHVYRIIFWNFDFTNVIAERSQSPIMITSEEDDVTKPKMVCKQVGAR